MLDDFHKHLLINFPDVMAGRHLIACSGGLDSRVLVHLCHSLDIEFEIAHCNFQLRNEESDTDEKFVEDLAVALHVHCNSRRFDTQQYAVDQGISTQMAARELRYTWFDQLLDQRKLNYVWTAHHLNDQLETFLMNLNRGTGLAGLLGIPTRNQEILRPLLPFSRQRIYEYAVDQNLDWREDSSNSSVKYQRNQIRHEVIPVLNKALPHVLLKFNSTKENLIHAMNILDDGVSRFRESVTHKIGSTHLYDISKILAYPNYQSYLYYTFQPYGIVDQEEINNLLHGQTGKRLLGSIHTLTRDREFLRLELSQSQNSYHREILSEEKDIIHPDGLIKLEVIKSGNLNFKENPPKNKFVLYIDNDRINYPLTLRYWKQGDRLYPYGMEGSQLVSDILTNKKISGIQRERSLVLEANERIIWLLGHRTSRHFMVTDRTKHILKISWEI